MLKTHPFISRFGLVITGTFITLIFFYRILLPYGDEPDFEVRLLELKTQTYPIWTPYFWFQENFNLFPIDSKCQIDAGPTAILAHIDYDTCSENIGQIFNRCIFTIFLCSPLLIALVFRKLTITILNLFTKKYFNDINYRIDSLGLSLLMPGMIYYLGLLSHEQLTLCLSLLIILVWGNWLITFIIASLVYTVDTGNSAIIFSYLLLHSVVFFIKKRLGTKAALFSLVFLVVLTYFTGIDFFLFIKNIFLTGKAEAMFNNIEEGDFTTKYPLILRPFITIMSGILMTASGIKPIPTYITFTLITLFYFSEKNIINIVNSDSLLTSICAISLILLFNFTLPDHSTAKYYIFLTPFLIRLALYLHSKWSILIFMLVNNIVSLLFFFFITT